MKLTYLILAHSNAGQMERMIRALDHENVEFIIHLDKKTDLKEYKSNPFLSSGNITFLKKRYSVNWGGFNMVSATLEMLKLVVRQRKKGYLVLLSGQDFPLKSASYIYNFLQTNYGNEYLEYFPLPTGHWGMNNGIGRLRYYWFIDKIGMEESCMLYELQKEVGKMRPYFQNLLPYGGSQWWCITYECAWYILKYLNFNKIYNDYYELTFIPDEMFFQTLIMNSPFKEQTVNNNLRYIDWVSGPEAPRVLTSDDLTSMVGSDRLWARKFSEEKDRFVLNEIEKMILA